MGVIRSLFGWIFILGGIYRVILGLSLIFFGNILLALDPAGSIFEELQVETTNFLAIFGVGYVLIGAFFIWLGQKIRSGGQNTIRI